MPINIYWLAPLVSLSLCLSLCLSLSLYICIIAIIIIITIIIINTILIKNELKVFTLKAIYCYLKFHETIASIIWQLLNHFLKKLY